MSFSEAFKHYGVSVKKVFAYSISASTAAAFLVYFAVFRLSGDRLPAAVFSLMTASALMAILLGLYPRRYSREWFAYTVYSNPVVNDLIINYSATGSLFNAVKKVAYSGIPHISRDFKEILNSLIKGESARELIREYAEKQPSEVFRDGLLSFLSMTEGNSSPSKLTSLSFNYTIGGRIREVEVKVTVYIALLFFAPMMVLMAVSLCGLPEMYLWLAPVLQVIISELFRVDLVLRKVL